MQRGSSTMHDDEAGEHSRDTRELTPLELEELVEPERRYKPEPDEVCEEAREDRKARPTIATRARKRTVRMRVFNFRALPKPYTEASVTPRSPDVSDASDERRDVR